MILPEIIVWSESWVLAHFDCAIRIASAQYNMAIKRNDALLYIDQTCVILDHNWLHRVKPDECSFLELDQGGSVGSSSLNIHDQRWKNHLLTQLLAVSHHR